MFDAGFSELFLIAIIGLLVIGPERLPKVAKTIGAYVGRAQRMFESVKSEVSKELAADELKKALEKQVGTDGGSFDIIEEAKSGMDELNRSLEDSLNDPGLNQPEIDTSALNNSADDNGGTGGAEDAASDSTAVTESK